MLVKHADQHVYKIHRYFDLPAILLRIVAIRLCRRYRGGVAGFVFLRPGRAVRIFLLKRNGLGAKRGGYTGKGRVILFANNPIYRWQNHGEFNMVFNALMNWNDVAEMVME